MRLKKGALLPVIFLFLSFNILSDGHEQQAPDLFPLETLQCNFNGNKDIDDLWKEYEEYIATYNKNKKSIKKKRIDWINMEG